jgi:hypothetical protein
MTDGIGFDAADGMLAKYEAAGWELVSISWDSAGGGFMGVWKRPIANGESVYDAVSRLRSWIRDYGDKKEPYFITDLKTVLDSIVAAE